jgi:hypothetical protein
MYGFLMGFLGVKPLSSYFEERRDHRGGKNQRSFEVKELLSEKSSFPPLIEGEKYAYT